MIPHLFAIAAGALLLGAVAHVNVIATGGYGMPQSWATLAIAFGVACAAICGGMAWSAGRHKLAVLLVTSIVAGEAYGLIVGAERRNVRQEAAQIPLREAKRAHAKALQRVKDAQWIVDHAPATSKWLEDANTAKAAADAAVIEKSAERDCRENCRQLLQARVDAAALQLKSAQTALGIVKDRAEEELAAARAALASIEAPQFATPPEDRSGVQTWISDLLQSALGSIAANGLACCLLLFGAHHPAQRVDAAEKSPGRFATRRSKGNNDDLNQQAARFAVECLQPDPNGEVDLLAIRDRYDQWCQVKRRLPEAKIGRALGDLLKDAGVKIADRNGHLVAMGVSLKEVDGGELLALDHQFKNAGDWRVAARTPRPQRR